MKAPVETRVATPVPPQQRLAPLALDMREEVVGIRVTVTDLNGRTENRAVPITVYRPAGEGPFPLVVFNHGRAAGAKRAEQTRYRPESAARYLVGKGFVVLVPNRIGYWETYSDFDPESNGNCAKPRIEPMSLAASDQVLATVEFAKTLPYVDASRWLVAGQSVGGLTAVTTVGRAPAGLLGGINFSGGTGGNRETRPTNPCNPQAIASYWGALAPHAKVPMLWVYWENDQLWGPDVPKLWHKAWTDGGGQATMLALGPTGRDGHDGLTTDMDHWVPAVDAFLGSLGFSVQTKPARPTSIGTVSAYDASKLPMRPEGKEAFSAFVNRQLPRAFAVGDRGNYGWATGDYAMGRALGNCQRSGQSCKLYAVDDDIVLATP